MGKDEDRHDEEVAAIRLRIDVGLPLIDTAKMYGEGRAEMLVGEEGPEPLAMIMI